MKNIDNKHGGYGNENAHGYEHGHEHGHGHGHHHVHVLPGEGGSLNSVFLWAIGLNLGYVVLEAVFGLINGSMGLLSDAGHNLSDVASLLIALIAYKASRKAPTARYSYGYGKATIEASLFNAVILYVAVILIAVEAIERLIHPRAIEGDVVAWVAGAGVIVNGVTAWMLMRHSKGDLNVRGAFMHMAADTAVSVGVVISGIVISFTDWYWLDPVVGILIAVMIAVSSWSLLRESMRMALDAVPENVDSEAIGKAILEVPEVLSFHHLHVWPISTTRTALTVHVVVADANDIDKAITEVRQRVKGLGIGHSTIEAETTAGHCPECECHANA